MKLLNKNLTGVLSAIICLALAPIAAEAQNAVEPAKSFSPTSIGPGEQSTLTVTITNDNPFIATGLAFTDPAPSGSTFVGTVPLTNTCGGVVSITPTELSVTGGTIPASGVAPGTCEVEIPVTTDLPSSAGTVNFVNTIAVGEVTTINTPANTTSASATLTSNLLNMTGDKVFVAPGGGNPNLVGGDSTKYFEVTLNNPNTFDLTGVAFDDVMDAQFRVLASIAPSGPLAPIAPLSTTCGTGSVTSVISGSTETVSLTGGTVPAGGSCVVRIFVEPTADLSTTTDFFNRPNIIPAATMRSDQGATNQFQLRSFDIDVRTGGSYGKSFSPTAIGLTDTSRLTISITNFNALSATGISWADFLPTGLEVVANTLSTSGSCGSPVQDNSNLNNAAVTNLTLSPNATCRLAFDVRGTTTGTFVNEIGGTGFPAIDYDDGRSAAFRFADAELSVGDTGGLGITKLMSPEYGGYVGENGALNVRNGVVLNTRIAINNPTGAAISDVNLVDDIQGSMGSRFEVIGSSIAFNGTGCVATTLEANEATDVVTLAGATVPAGTQCELDFDVINTGNGRVDARNVIQGSDVTIGGVAYPFDIRGPAVRHETVLSAVKEFSPETVGENGVSRMTVNLFVFGRRDYTMSELNFVDNLPTGTEVAANPDPVSTCGGLITGAPLDPPAFPFLAVSSKEH